MSRLTTSNLIRFSPGAGDGGDESDPVSRFELSLSTRLEGGATSRGAAAARLSATLIVAFAFALVMGLCKRLRLTGITAPGHADLTIPGAAYNDSTCAYAGPEESDPLAVYLDLDPETTIKGWTLKIHWPNRNWYPAFDWPGPLYAVDPPFRDDEQRPPALFKLKAFEAHTSRWTEDDDGTPVFEDYGGVRIPMKLVLDPGMSRPYRVVKDLTGEDCPVLTGGGTSITLKDGGPVFEVTMEEIADALTGLTDLYGADDREGVYSLKWIVYKGDGDMIYEAECYDGSSLGTYTDRRTGAEGVFETDSKDVARIKAVKAPETFLLADTDYLYTFSTAGTRVRALKSGSYGAGTRAWFGASGEILTWAGSSIYLGAWRYVAPTPVRCACLVTRTITQTPPDDPPGEEPRTESLLCLQVFGEDRRLYWYVFAQAKWMAVGQAEADPSYTYPAQSDPPIDTTMVNGYPDTCEFSQDGNHILIAGAPRADHQLLYPGVLPGVVWTSDITAVPDAATVSEWAVAHIDPAMGLEHTQIGRDVQGVGTLRRLIACGYHENRLVIQQAEIILRYAAGWRGRTEAWSYSFIFNEEFYEYEVPFTLVSYRERFLESTLSIAVFEDDACVFEAPNAGVHEIAGEWMRESASGVAFALRGGEDGVEETEAWAKIIVRSAIDAAAHEISYKFGELCGHSNTLDGTTVSYECGTFGSDIRQDEAIRIPLLGRANYQGLRRGGCVASLGSIRVQDATTTYPDPPRLFAGQQPILTFTSTEPAMDRSWVLTPPTSRLTLAQQLASNFTRLHKEELWLLVNTRQAPDATLLAHMEMPNESRVALSSGVAMNPSGRPVLGVTAPFYPPPATVDWPDIPTWSTLGRPTAADLLKAHNAVRQELGLAALTLNTELSQAAALHVAWMDETGIFSHEGRNDSTPMQRAADAGYDGFVGENLAMGYPTIAEVMSGWQASPDHWENILDPNWRDVGVFIWPSTTLGYFLWCVVFGFKSA